LVAPNLWLAAAKATVKGAGKDALSLRAGLATNGVTPASAPDVVVGFGGSATATIPSASFKRSGDRYVFAGNVGGITKVVLDYLRETVTVVGKGMTLGSFPDGAQPVVVSIAVGADSRAVRVRMVKKGAALKY